LEDAVHQITFKHLTGFSTLYFVTTLHLDWETKWYEGWSSRRTYREQKQGW